MIQKASLCLMTEASENQAVWGGELDGTSVGTDIEEYSSNATTPLKFENQDAIEIGKTACWSTHCLRVHIFRSFVDDDFNILSCFKDGCNHRPAKCSLHARS